MKNYVISMVLGGLALAVAAPAATAGPVARACMASDRQAATRAMCGCIQSVADATLTGRDQRLAAKFFSDPHRAQEVRQSDRAADEAFWDRYRVFGDAAERSCAG